MMDFPNGISSSGIPLGGNNIPTTFGTVYFVDYDNGSDGYSTKSNSIRRPFKTISKAYGLATTNKNDVIALSAYSTHPLTEMLTVAKNRVHFVGLDCASRMYGQGAKISMGVTTAATDIAAVKNTGARNSFRNIKFSSSNTKAESLYTFADGGEYMFMDHCEVYKSSDMDETGASEFVANGDSALITNTTIGSLVDLNVGTGIRANVRVTQNIAGQCRDTMFKNCMFWKKAAHVNNRFVYGANAADVERMLLFDGCLFFSQKLSSAAPAQCVAFGAEQTAGYCLIRNCDSIGNTKLSTTTGVYITGTVPS